ncbi:hypothetical protein BDZ97DRAFT_1816100 [Flammula alnicola]|nr:hypothetical protein BDZ97DRAFT_1816100 [Flammula alnicola]
MDFDSAWCPACDRQIQPKRYTIQVPTTTSIPHPPPPPPSSPRRSKGTIKQKAGLVNGTGRMRHNGTIKTPPQVVMKQRTVIDQGPTPLYCSDECQFADLNSRRRGAPIDPASEEPNSKSAPIKPSNKKAFTTAPSETDSDASSSDSSPPPPMTSMEKFAAMYNFPPMPPPPPPFDEPMSELDYAPREYNSGIMMAGRLISSLCPPPAKPQVGPYRTPQEPRKPIPGWTDGSNAWRSAVYSFTAPNTANDPFHREAAAKAYGSFSASSHRSSRGVHVSRASSSSTLPSLQTANAAAASFHSASDDMISKFAANFSRRSESRASLYAGGGSATSPVPSSAGSTHSLPIPSPKRERSLLHRGAEGKLLVPDVKMKVHSGSSASLSSTWSGPGSSSAASRRSTSVRSPLSVTSDSDDDTERCDSKASLRRDVKRPTVENTRSWSYDNVQTYDIMPIPPKKVKKMEKRIVDGEEREVEVEVEEYPERKRLFLFAPTRISTP